MILITFANNYTIFGMFKFVLKVVDTFLKCKTDVLLIFWTY